MSGPLAVQAVKSMLQQTLLQRGPLVDKLVESHDSLAKVIETLQFHHCSMLVKDHEDLKSLYTRLRSGDV